jgi:hypothetical protein
MTMYSEDTSEESKGQRSMMRALLAVVAALTVSGCPGASPTGPPSQPRSTLPDDTGIQWHQADTLAIQIGNDPKSDVWNAGHVNDIIKLNGDGGLLVAAETGGVWGITIREEALPLSYSWTSVAMTSLALGPDGPRHIYAATFPGNGLGSSGGSPGPGGYLYETDSSATFPLFNWRQVSDKPQCTAIWKVLVVNRVIVLACDNGIWWSNVPPAPSVSGTYKWNQAVAALPLLPLPKLTATFSGLALGPATGDGRPTIIASVWGGVAPGTEIYWGSWSNGDLVFQSSVVVAPNSPGQFFPAFGRTSVASCAQDATQVYAVAADSNDANMAAVWKSNDGGRNWAPVTLPPAPGAQGQYNNAIAVAADCHAVAVGWEGSGSGGTFVSYDSGSSWTKLTADGLADGLGPYSNLHSDVHALTFDPADPTTLYIGSDGGVASASGLVLGGTPTYVSSYNRQLFNMQLYHAGASSQLSGLVAAGLQDNGVLYAQLPGAWIHLTVCGCDASYSSFVSPPGLTPGTDILIEGEFSGSPYPWNWAQTNASGNPAFAHNSQQGIPWTIIPSLVTTIPSGGPLAVVKSPSYMNEAGQYLHAVAGFGQTLYGLFINGDGSNIHWELLGYVGSGQNASAISSSDGANVFVGTNIGNIFRLDPPYNGGSAAQLTVNNPPGDTGAPTIGAIVELSPSNAFAALNMSGNGYVLAWNGQTWDQVGVGSLPSNLPFTAVEAPDLGSVFVSSIANVYSSHDLGSSWMIASDGLPVVAQATDLHAVTQPDGTRYLYLATYGWSLWRAALP